MSQENPEDLPLLPVEHLVPEAPIPEEARAIEPALEVMWDREIDAEFRKMPVTYMKFVSEWVKGGMQKPYEAYQKAVDPGASKAVAQAAARMIMRSKGVKMFMDRLKDCATEDFFAVRQTLVDSLEAKDEIWVRGPAGTPINVGESPAWAARIRAAEVLAKLHGLNAPEKHEVKSESRSVVIEVQLPALKPLDGA